MHKQLLLTILATTCLLATSSAQAAIKCWKNKDNVRECGQTVPQEYSQQRIEVINDKGIIVRIIDRAKTPEELAEFKRQEALRKIKEREKAAAKRKDLVLLQTYTTEKDLLLARKQNLRAVDGIISITNSNTKTLKDNLAVLEKRAADYERSGEQPSEELLTDMENLRDQIKDNQDFIDKKMLAKKRTETKFDVELKRFRELKGIKPPKGGNNKQAKPAAKP